MIQGGFIPVYEQIIRFLKSRNIVYLVWFLELIPHDVYDVTEKGPYIQMPRLSS